MPSRQYLRAVSSFVAERVAKSSMAACGVAVVSGSDCETYVCGASDTEEDVRASAATLFHICSCSKAFTAMAMASLIEGGAASWDTSVREILPEFALSDPWVTQRSTLRDFAGMRLGLSSGGIAEWGFRAEATTLVRLARAKVMPFDAPFRDRFSYSNLSYIALAGASARLAGSDYAQCVRDIVFAPRGMMHATLAPSQNSAKPHLPIGGRMVPVPELTGESSEGSARVHLCASDAAAWLAFLLRAVRGDEGHAAAEMFRPQSLVRPLADTGDGLPLSWAYGFGWHLSTFQGRALFQHGGGGRGWRAAAILDPERNTGVMVFAAHEGSIVEALALSLLELAAGETPGDWESVLSARADRLATARNAATGLRTRPDEERIETEEITGSYSNAVTGNVRIAAGRDGAIHFSAEDAPAFDAQLCPVGDGVLEFRFENPALTTMKNDPLFQARIARAQKNGQVVVETTYFGTLEKQH
jgi:CubicO group peptidase (beta-lactamase class C family)